MVARWRLVSSILLLRLSWKSLLLSFYPLLLLLYYCQQSSCTSVVSYLLLNMGATLVNVTIKNSDLLKTNGLS